MQKLLTLFGVGMCLAPAAWGENGCRAYQVSCLPELGMMELRTLAYQETNACRHSAADAKALAAKGIFPLDETNASPRTFSCVLGRQPLMMTISTKVENTNIQGHCGDFGPIAVVFVARGPQKLVETLPLQSCYENYDVGDMTMREESGNVSVSFSGHVKTPFTEFSAKALAASPSTIVPITREKVVGK